MFNTVDWVFMETCVSVISTIQWRKIVLSTHICVIMINTYYGKQYLLIDYIYSDCESHHIFSHFRLC